MASNVAVVEIRLERPADVAAIGTVHRLAFPTDAEARLVEALRAVARYAKEFSLVA